ncbi:DNA-binding NarL/FixJ family response regulator [Actinomycetospora succinea]|uniref:DNA-binding NarL/FixJ family response regulator n=1 Tax=Actinomycetospora succinea TaxID=663603 RepID=A0A4R6VGT2_9PSEU|nr:DNA-binding NarL/FixJ family response regulator [Actinomycetospora succinea]
MGSCLVFAGATPARERLVGHLSSVFDDLPCVDNVPDLVGRLAATAEGPAPDVVLVGADEGSAWMEAVRQVRRRTPETPVLVVGEPPASAMDPLGDRPAPDPAGIAEDERATYALRLGARGFLRAGELADPSVLPGARPATTDLSDREMDVLLGMTEGLSNAEIAAELVLAEDTVKTHARRLFRKLGAGDRADAVARGFRQGLLR